MNFQVLEQTLSGDHLQTICRDGHKYTVLGKNLLNHKQISYNQPEASIVLCCKSKRALCTMDFFVSVHLPLYWWCKIRGSVLESWGDYPLPLGRLRADSSPLPSRARRLSPLSPGGRELERGRFFALLRLPGGRLQFFCLLTHRKWNKLIFGIPPPYGASPTSIPLTLALSLGRRAMTNLLS